MMIFNIAVWKDLFESLKNMAKKREIILVSFVYMKKIISQVSSSPSPSPPPKKKTV